MEEKSRAKVSDESDLVECDMSSTWMSRHLMKDVLGGRDEPRNEKLNEKESCHVAVVAKEAVMNRTPIPSRVATSIFELMICVTADIKASSRLQVV